MNQPSPNVNIDVSNPGIISTPSTSPEPVEAKENESPADVSPTSGKPTIGPKSSYELRPDGFSPASTASTLLHHKSNFPISSLISSRACTNSDFINTPAFISSIRHPFYQSGVSLFDRSPFFREISMPPHFVPPFNSIKSSLFSAFNSNDK